MPQFIALLRRHSRLLAAGVSVVALISGLLLYHLGSLTHGVSRGEAELSHTPLGWHYFSAHPFMPLLTFLHSVIFKLYPVHTAFGLRLPNAVIGVVTIGLFAVVMRWWHSRRIALLATALFACSAWILHVSRLASSDVMYLSLAPLLLLLYGLVQRYSEQFAALLLTALGISYALTIPGGVWLVILWLYFSRGALMEGWKELSGLGRKAGIFIAGLLWLPLLLHAALQQPGAILRTWVGLPDHFTGLSHLIKQVVAVPVHLFIRGPQYPDIWLGKAPVLDVFSLLLCLLGIYFYATHLQAARSRLLLGMALIGGVLVGLGGPVSLSLLVPLLYVAIAAGATYLLRKWLSVFPLNPIARGFGIGLVVIAVCLSCVYNVRSYFIAWAHNSDTQATFHYHP